MSKYFIKNLFQTKTIAVATFDNTKYIELIRTELYSIVKNISQSEIRKHEMLFKNLDLKALISVGVLRYAPPQFVFGDKSPQFYYISHNLKNIKIPKHLNSLLLYKYKLLGEQVFLTHIINDKDGKNQVPIELQVCFKTQGLKGLITHGYLKAIKNANKVTFALIYSVNEKTINRHKPMKKIIVYRIPEGLNAFFLSKQLDEKTYKLSIERIIELNKQVFMYYRTKTGLNWFKLALDEYLFFDEGTSQYYLRFIKKEDIRFGNMGKVSKQVRIFKRYYLPLDIQSDIKELIPPVNQFCEVDADLQYLLKPDGEVVYECTLEELFKGEFDEIRKPDLESRRQQVVDALRKVRKTLNAASLTPSLLYNGSF